MHRKHIQLVSLFVVAMCICASLPTVSAQVDSGGVTSLRGSIEFINPYLALEEDKPYVLLFDQTGYVTGDPGYQIPVTDQVIGPVEMLGERTASYQLQLPVRPQGGTHSFGPDNGSADGVQIYSLEYVYEWDGTPFVDPRWTADMAGGLSSLAWDQSTGEVIGGTLFVWAEKESAPFPNGFGPDGVLFTEDDPLTTIDAGWTAVEIGPDGFVYIRSEVYETTIHEPEGWYHDLSDLGYVEAFNSLMDDLEQQYPFSAEKGVNWSTLRARYLPDVRDAERRGDAQGFMEVLHAIASSIDDGHVYAPGPDSWYDAEYAGFLGLWFAATASGELVVTRTWDTPYIQRSGIKVGAEILAWNGGAPEQAIAVQEPIYQTSSPHAKRAAQVESLAWGPVDGNGVELRFRNIGEEPADAVIRYEPIASYGEYLEQFQYGWPLLDQTVLPLTAMVLPSGIGYIRLTSFWDDPILTRTAWDHALRSFRDLEIGRVIVDVRGNGGGWVSSALDLAGSVPYVEPINFLDEWVDPASGEPLSALYGVGDRSEQYGLFSMAVLIDAHCASACELFTAAVAESDVVIVVGETATSGAVSGMSEWALPDDLYFGASTTRTSLEGEPILEGRGVAPDVVVPVTVESIQDSSDDVLNAAIDALGGAW